MGRIRFNPEINAGSIMTSITMICCVVGAYFKLENKVDILEQKVTFTQRDVANVSEKVDNLFYYRAKPLLQSPKGSE